MNLKNNIKNIATRLLLVFLILGQLSNSFLVFDIMDIREKIVLNNDIDNNSKEDKNNTDVMEESKILEEYYHSLLYFNGSSTTDYVVQSFFDVSNSKDFPPPEINS
ncbi:hypothetical protein N9T96_00025 [Flavobacteriaceae bacterium]|nr:hypothetical protein [Flavobacteriaceae bacterium]